jgi:hypothetical protein
MYSSPNIVLMIKKIDDEIGGACSAHNGDNYTDTQNFDWQPESKFGQFLRDYTAQHPIGQSISHSPPSEHEMSPLICVLPYNASRVQASYACVAEPE